MFAGLCRYRRRRCAAVDASERGGGETGGLIINHMTRKLQSQIYQSMNNTPSFSQVNRRLPSAIVCSVSSRGVIIRRKTGARERRMEENEESKRERKEKKRNPERKREVVLPTYCTWNPRSVNDANRLRASQLPGVAAPEGLDKERAWI